MKLIYLLLTLFIFLSCEENEDVITNNCTDNPLQNIAWLKAIVDNESRINRIGSIRITQYTYKGGTAFLIDDCIGNGCADNLATLYDCEKNKLCEFGGVAGVNTCTDFENEAINPILLYPTPSGSSCDKVTLVDNALFNETEASPFINAEITGNCISISFAHAPECSDRINNVNLIDSGNILESFPVQRNLKFNITLFQEATASQNLLCDALQISTTSFDISNLAAPNEVVILNIEGFENEIRFSRVPQCSDPTINCANGDYTEELNALEDLQQEILQIAQSETECTDPSEWQFIFLNNGCTIASLNFTLSPILYSNQIDVDLFLQKVANFRNAEERFIEKWKPGIICADFVISSGIECENGKAVLIYD